MTTINLLPWREELREQAKQQFYVVLAGAAIIGAGTVFLGYMNIQQKIEHQVAQNQFIKQETSLLDKEISQIEKLEEEKSRLVSRIELIGNLQGNRHLTVRHFNELAVNMPDGVYLTRLDKRLGRFNIEGVADANSRITSLMRNLDDSNWFKQSDLNRISTVAGSEDDEDGAAGFVLSVLEEMPEIDKQNDEES